jgi:hypothetical protein
MTWTRIFRSDMGHIAESQHWYARTGDPAYTVLAKNGEPRNVTLRDAKKSGLVPSVTGIIRMMDAPGLVQWKLRQAVLSALTHPGLTSADSDIEKILYDARQEGIKAAERGTRIHACVQGHFEGQPPDEEFYPHAKGAETALTEAFGKRQWICEKSFAHPMGFGGKVDIHTPEIVVDFKSKEFGHDDKLGLWDEQCMQLAAYSHGLFGELDRAAICYVSATNPGLAKVIECTSEDLARGWEMFRACLALWKAKNRHDGGWQ